MRQLRSYVSWSTDESKFWWSVAKTAGPIAAIDFLVPLVMSSEYIYNPLLMIFVYLALGLILAQAAFLAIAHVLGPGPLTRRTMIAWSLGAVCGLLWALGVAFNYDLGRRSEVARDLLASLGLIPFFVLALQSPLWLARLTWGWRFTHSESQDRDCVSLADLFTLTTIAAATLGLAQFSHWLISWGSQDAALWIWRSVSGGVLAVVGGLQVTPLLWYVLKRRQFSSGMVWAVGGPALFTAVAIAVLLLTMPQSWIASIACGWAIPMVICTVALSHGLEGLGRAGWVLKTSQAEWHTRQ